MKTTTIRVTLLLVVFMSWCPAVRADATVDSIHQAAWDTVLDEAETSPAVRYAFYAYRTLAVPHPDIYLKGDSLFSEIIENVPGTRAVYRGVDPRDLDAFRRIREGAGRGPSFRWRLWAPFPDSVYDDTDETTVSWLDRRLPPAAVLLRADSKRLNSAEAAIMRYTQYRRQGTSSGQAYIIIDTAGHGYIVRDTLIRDGAGAGAVISDPRAIRPALIFNERSVYYPLFDRDDRGRDPGLKNLAARLGEPGTVPLTEAERRRIDRLRIAAGLPSPQSRTLAMLISTGVPYDTLPQLKQAWEACVGGLSPSPRTVDRGMLGLSFYWANRLSVPAAEFVAMADDTGDIGTVAPRWADAYLDLCGRRVNPSDSADTTREALGFLWSPRMPDIVFDDIIRTRAGLGSSQAFAMGAILDQAGFPNYRLEVISNRKGVPDQHWILAGEGHWQFNAGRWRHIPDSIVTGARNSVLLASYGHEGGWTNLYHLPVYSSVDNLSVISDMARVRAILKAAAVYIIDSRDHNRPVQELVSKLTQDEVLPEPMPWPDLHSAGSR